jgi:ribosomal protein L10
MEGKHTDLFLIGIKLGRGHFDCQRPGFLNSLLNMPIGPRKAIQLKEIASVLSKPSYLVFQINNKVRGGFPKEKHALKFLRVKNALFDLVVDKEFKCLAELKPLIKGPLALGYHDADSADIGDHLAWIDQGKDMILLWATIDGMILSNKDVQKCLAVPKLQLYSKLIGLLSSANRQLLYSLQSPTTGFVRLLNAKCHPN